MDTIIHIANGDYPRYEALILQREQLRKEAEEYRRLYVLEFGEHINEIFRLKISCIAKKKSIAYCQKYRNSGKKPDMAELKRYIDVQMTAYRIQLEEMIEERNNAKPKGVISAEDYKELRSIYRRIARQIHPDISPLMAEIPELKELWNISSEAYRCNDIDLIREAEFMIGQILQKANVEGFTIEIPDMAERIQKLEFEINQIVTTEPYTYKKILENPNAVRRKKSELEDELQSYIRYEKELSEQLERMM